MLGLPVYFQSIRTVQGLGSGGPVFVCGNVACPGRRCDKLTWPQKRACKGHYPCIDSGLKGIFLRSNRVRTFFLSHKGNTAALSTGDGSIPIWNTTYQRSHAYLAGGLVSQLEPVTASDTCMRPAQHFPSPNNPWKIIFLAATEGS